MTDIDMGAGFKGKAPAEKSNELGKEEIMQIKCDAAIALHSVNGWLNSLSEPKRSAIFIERMKKHEPNPKKEVDIITDDMKKIKSNLEKELENTSPSKDVVQDNLVRLFIYEKQLSGGEDVTKNLINRRGQAGFNIKTDLESLISDLENAVNRAERKGVIIPEQLKTKIGPNEAKSLEGDGSLWNRIFIAENKFERMSAKENPLKTIVDGVRDYWNLYPEVQSIKQTLEKIQNEANPAGH